MGGKLLIYIGIAVLGAAGACVIVSAAIQEKTHAYIFALSNALPTTEVAIVPGASVTSSGALSPVFKERLDAAFALYQEHKVAKILITGDNATVSHNEVDPAGKYLAGLGVPHKDIFLDHAGFDTYSSMYRAKDVFEVTSATIVSQPFHLPRAVYIARELGINAFGSPAGNGEWFVLNYLREIPATLKALGDLAMNRTPEYLGTQYPITGPGDQTWSGATTTIPIWK